MAELCLVRAPQAVQSAVVSGYAGDHEGSAEEAACEALRLPESHPCQAAVSDGTELYRRRCVPTRDPQLEPSTQSGPLAMDGARPIPAARRRTPRRCPGT